MYNKYLCTLYLFSLETPPFYTNTKILQVTCNCRKKPYTYNYNNDNVTCVIKIEIQMYLTFYYVLVYTRLEVMLYLDPIININYSIILRSHFLVPVYQERGDNSDCHHKLYNTILFNRKHLRIIKFIKTMGSILNVLRLVY
jgi:hypothetical protein